MLKEDFLTSMLSMNPMNIRKKSNYLKNNILIIFVTKL